MPIDVLSYGYKKPVAPATGDEVFPAMEDNVELMNSHTHDGDTGAPIPYASAELDSGDWIAASPNYYQDVAIEAPYNYDTCVLHIRKSDGSYYTPVSVTRIGLNTARVTVNSNALNLVVMYK